MSFVQPVKKQSNIKEKVGWNCFVFLPPNSTVAGLNLLDLPPIEQCIYIYTPSKRFVLKRNNLFIPLVLEQNRSFGTKALINFLDKCLKNRLRITKLSQPTGKQPKPNCHKRIVVQYEHWPNVFLVRHRLNFPL